jgi:hypothetical protein
VPEESFQFVRLNRDNLLFNILILGGLFEKETGIMILVCSLISSADIVDIAWNPSFFSLKKELSMNLFSISLRSLFIS